MSIAANARMWPLSTCTMRKLLRSDFLQFPREQTSRLIVCQGRLSVTASRRIRRRSEVLYAALLQTHTSQRLTTCAKVESNRYNTFYSADVSALKAVDTQGLLLCQTRVERPSRLPQSVSFLRDQSVQEHTPLEKTRLVTASFSKRSCEEVEQSNNIPSPFAL
jgi:hypothetical protein